MTYIFDFDGVLVDSMPTWAGTYVNLMESHNIPYPDDFVKTFTPLGNRGAAELCVKLGLPMTVEEILTHAMSVYRREYIGFIPAKSNVCETIHRLYKEGHTLAVLTASSHDYLDACLKRLGIFECFTRVWSVDEFPYTKANTEIYHEAARLLRTPVSSCTFLDDNYVAIKTAHEAGMRTIGVYDSYSDDYVDLMKETADGYIYDFGELK